MNILTSKKYLLIWTVVVICFLFLLLRLPSIIEPNWYGDEGIYQVIGQTMHNGALLYKDIWDNKPPLLYIIYALADGSQAIVRTYSLIAGLLSLVVLFLLTQLLFRSRKTSLLVTLVYTLFFATPLIEGNIANAENFLLVLTLLGAYLLYSSTEKQTRNTILYLISGCIMGLAFLLKIVALFDLLAFLFFLITLTHSKGIWKTLGSKTKILFPIIVGWILPITICALYFIAQNAFAAFIEASLLGNVGYVGWKNELFGIPQGLLLVKLFLLLLAISILFLFRKRLSKQAYFIFLWFCFSFFSVFFSGRPYIHYMLVVLPAYCLLIGLLYTKHLHERITALILLLCSTIMLLSFFGTYGITKTITYYSQTYSFLFGKSHGETYQRFFDPKVPRDYFIAQFITSHTTANDTVYIWGNNPQIYALAHKQPITRYTVAYHLTNTEAFETTQKTLDRARPKFIIVLHETAPLPFRIPLYIMRFSIDGATIYERAL